MNFWSYKKTKSYLKKKGINNFDDWKKFIELSSFPQKSIPLDPQNFYYKKWLGWDDFFGKLVNYTEFKKILKKNSIKNIAEYYKFYNKYIKEDDKKPKIPRQPQYSFRNKWKGWEEETGYYIYLKFLTKSEEPRLIVEYKKRKNNNLYKNRFIELRKYARSLKLKNQKQWLGHFSNIINQNINEESDYESFNNDYSIEDNFNYGKNEIPQRILKIDFPKPKFYWPELFKAGLANPARTFKNHGWKSWGDFLGNSNINKNRKEWSSFDLAKKYVKLERLKNRIQWENHYKKNNGNFYLNSKKIFIPQRPDRIEYYKKVWKGWKNFLSYSNKKTN